MPGQRDGDNRDEGTQREWLGFAGKPKAGQRGDFQLNLEHESCPSKLDIWWYSRDVHFVPSLSLSFFFHYEMTSVTSFLELEATSVSFAHLSYCLL